MRILKDLKWFFIREKKKYIIGVLALFAISLLNLIPPRIIGYHIDLISSNGLTKESLITLVLLFLFVALSVYGLRYIWRIFIFGTSFRLENEIRNDLFSHFTKMSSTFYHQYRVGELMAHATHDLKSVQAVAGMGVLQLADAVLSGTTVLLAMFISINWKLTLMALIPMPFLVIFSQLISKKLHKAFNSAQESFSDMNNRVLENINGMKVTKTFGQEKYEVENFKNIANDVYQKNLRVTKYEALFDPMIVMIITISLVFSIITGTYLIMNNEITTGDFVVFISYIHQLTWPMMAIGFMYNTMNRGTVSYDRIKELLSITEDIKDHDNAITSSPSNNINFSINTFTYPDDETVSKLSDIKFDLNTGETLGIVGKTGSGKSTIIRLLLREYDVEDGEIIYGNKNIKDYSLNSYRNAFGYVPQDPFLFSLTILDNIRFGKPEATVEEVYEAARIANVHDDIESFPLKYETMIGERGVSLSGGQKQRIAMARAILLNSECLILDDALSAVDAKTEEIILSNLRELRSSKTTIIIAHRFSALKHAHNIIVLGNGTIEEEGTHQELIDNNGWYSEIFKLQEFSKEREIYE